MTSFRCFVIVRELVSVVFNSCHIAIFDMTCDIKREKLMDFHGINKLSMSQGIKCLEENFLLTMCVLFHCM